MRSPILIACACLSVLVAACRAADEGTPAAPPAAPPKAAALGEAALESPRVRVRLTEVARTGPEALRVTLVVSNPGAAPVRLGAAFAGAEADADTAAGLSVVDEAHEKKYFVLRDDQGRASCSAGGGEIPAGGEREIWVRLAAPPRGVDVVTVQLRGLPPFRNVPLAPRAGDERAAGRAGGNR